MQMPLNGALVPESNIRAWLQLQNHAAFLGKPPASPPPTPRNAGAGTTVSTPPPHVVRNQPLIDRLSSSFGDTSAAPLLQPPLERSEDGSGASPHALDVHDGDAVWDAHSDDEDDASASRSIAFRSENASPDDDCTPRHALGVAPTPPNLDSSIRAYPDGAAAGGAAMGGQRQVVLHATVLGVATDRQALCLEERGALLRAIASFQCTTTAMQRAPPLGRRVSAVPMAHAAAMTAPFVGFGLADYVSFEVRRLSAMEVNGRALIESEQGRLRLEAVEYPSFRRTAQCTVAKLEKLYWKQERELRGALRSAEREHRTASQLQRSSGATPSTPVPPLPPPSQDAQMLEQLRSLLMEADEVVWPSLKDVSLNLAAVTSEDVGALEAVTVLLCKELREVRDALQDRNAMVSRDQSALPPMPHRQGNATPLSPPTTCRSDLQAAGTASHASIGGAKASSMRPEMGALVSALLEQNQVLLEGLQHAEACGYQVPPDIVRRLKLSAT